MVSLFNTLLYNPLYNTFIGLIDVFPWLDAGIVVILFTVLVKLVLFPLSQKAVKSQMEIQRLQPEIDELKLKHKDNKQEQAMRTMALYKSRGVNPFAGILLLLIQFPILIALYFVFYRGGLDVVPTGILYPFIQPPTFIDKMFLGLLDVTEKSTILAALVAISQYFQMRFTLPKQDKVKNDAKNQPSFQGELAKNMQFQMKYVMPVIMFFVAQSLAAIVSLYFVTSNLFAIGQELYVRRKYKK